MTSVFVSIVNLRIYQPLPTFKVCPLLNGYEMAMKEGPRSEKKLPQEIDLDNFPVQERHAGREQVLLCRPYLHGPY